MQINSATTQSDTLTIENNALKTMSSSESTVHFIKAYIGKQEATHVSTTLTKKDIDRAIAMAKASSAKKYFYGIPDRARPRKIPLYDRKVASMTPDDLVDYGKQIIERVKTPIVSITQSKVAREVQRIDFISTNGTQYSEKKTSMYSWAGTVARKGTSTSTYFENHHSVRYKKPEYHKLADKTLFYLAQSRLKQKIPIVILKPSVLADLLSNAFLDNLNGKEVEMHKSILKGKMGQRVLGNISITDDGRMPYGTETSAIDFEGTPTCRTRLFNKGRLTGFIYDHNTARHAGQKSTGNASASGIGFSNVILGGPFSDVRKAIVIENVIGSHTANPVTTEFSVNVSNAYILDNGKKTPVTDFMLSGRMIDVLRAAISISKKSEHHSGIHTGALSTKGINIVL